MKLMVHSPHNIYQAYPYFFWYKIVRDEHTKFSFYHFRENSRGYQFAMVVKQNQ